MLKCVLLSVRCVVSRTQCVSRFYRSRHARYLQNAEEAQTLNRLVICQ